MRDYLVFALTATIGAMGDLAGHERRGTELWPGRSAVLGLVSAALGIRRGGDFSVVDRLGLAVAVFEAGTPLRDYHTVETVPTAAARRPNSRAEALEQAGRRTNTTITMRDYRCGVVYGVALWDGPLERMAAAMAAPAFALYLGRRSCPLSAPLHPRLVRAVGPEQALAGVKLPPWIGVGRAGMLYLDAASGEAGPVRQTLVRHDQPLDRERRHFGPRSVVALQVEIEAAPIVAQA